MSKQYKETKTESAGTIAPSGTATVTFGSGFLDNATDAAITAQIRYDASATASVDAYIFSSPDGSLWDTDELTSFSPSVDAGGTVVKTAIIDAVPHALKVELRNTDATYGSGTCDVYMTAVHET